MRPRSPSVLPALLAIAAAFFVATLAVKAAGADGGAARAIDTRREANVPTVWSALLLLVAGVLCALAARRAPGRARTGGLVAGVVLALLAVDELAQWHERSAGVLTGAGEALGLGGNAARAFAVLVVLAGCAALAVVLLPWLRSLPRPLLRAVVLGGGIYLASALGLEVVGRAYEESGGGTEDTFTVVRSAVEELGEMAGASVVLAAFADRRRAA